MATITGPRVQMPSTAAEMFQTDAQGRIIGIKPEWAQFFHALEGISNAHTKSGPTSSRPTSTMQWRYVGMPFFDTTLGLTVFLKIASTSVWVKADGTVA